jgi:hypothetical protein
MFFFSRTDLECGNRASDPSPIRKGGAALLFIEYLLNAPIASGRTVAICKRPDALPSRRRCATFIEGHALR